MNHSSARHGCRGRFIDRGGFTLIEVLVAFAVMATLLSVLFRGVVTIRAGSISFDDHTHQDIVARAVLEDMLAKRDLANGTYTGLRDGRRWTVVATSVDLSGQLPPPAPDDADQKTAVAPGSSPATPENGTPPQTKKADSDPHWRPQRLIVRLATSSGKPLEIETVRLVKAELRE